MLQAGSNKFSNAGQVGVVEAIDAGLSAKVSLRVLRTRRWCR
jgi:hypothetical protein